MSLKKASRTKSLSLSDDFPTRIVKQKNLLTTSSTSTSKRIEDTGKFIKYIDDNVIGKGVAFLGPFGRRKVVYADYSSSGRSLQFLEDYINKEVLPAFGDISCTSAVTGLQSQLYSNEARDLVRSAVNASEDDHVFFCEGASTCPSERLCYLLCYENDETFSINNNDNNNLRQRPSPVLFVSVNESAKNLAPWLGAGVELVKISKTHEGFLDLVDLEKKLSAYADSNRLLIGLFAGASRLTGILADDVATTILLHQYGAISVWDYSPAAPYAPIDMNPLLPGAAKDVIFFSTTKYIGGVQGPGVVVIKKRLIQSQKARNSLEIHNSVGVIDCIRAGLVIQLKESLGTQHISNRLEKLCKQVLSHIRTIPEIILLGPTQTTAKRIPTICFLVKHPRGAFLHHRFVVAVLNDVFGIQATACNHIGDSLGISKKLSVDYERVLHSESSPQEYLRPGYTKLLIPFFMSESEVAFIMESLKMVATEAWKLLPQYEIDEKTGEWKHHSNSLIKERKWLSSIRYTDGRMLFSDRRISGPGTFPQNYSDCLQTARNLFNRSRKIAQKSATPYLELKLRNTSAEILRWFMLPGEAHQLLIGQSQNVKNCVPFDPNKSRVKDPPSLLNMFRHNSLSALDVKRFKSRSLPTSPVQISVKRQQSSPSTAAAAFKAKSLVDCNCTSPPVVRFSLGGEVTTLANFTSPKISTLVHNEEGVSSRNRCHSWSSNGGNGKNQKTTSAASSTITKSTFAPQTRISLGFALPKYYTASNAIAINNNSNCNSSNNSYGSSNNSSPPLIIYRVKSKQRLCSCSSQTDLFSPQDSVDNSSPTPSLQNSYQAGSTCSDCTEEIQAYVAEVTKELATEIKSEIREVISKVEDVLENTDAMDVSSINMSSLSLTNLNTTDESRSDSVSATDVAEYLKEFSKEMAHEVKSEIREAVSAMTDSFNESLNTATCQRKAKTMNNDKSLTTTSSLSLSLNGNCENSSSNSARLQKNSLKLVKQNYSDTSATAAKNDTNHKKKNTLLEDDENEPHRTESFPRPHSTPGWHLPITTAPSPESSTPNCPYTGAISKLMDPIGTASQDSGINMCFHEQDETRQRTASENLAESNRPKISRRSQSDSVHSVHSAPSRSFIHNESQLLEEDGCDRINCDCKRRLDDRLPNRNSLVTSSNTKSSATVTIPTVTTATSTMESSIRRQPSDQSDPIDEEFNKWHHLPKDVWKSTAEAIDEFDMIKDGDRILVCISGSSPSLLQLNALRQFTRARGIHIDMAAITVGKCGIDPRALMLYMRNLNIDLFIEQLEPSENYRGKIFSVARRKKFNVLAMGNTLDKIADNFIISVFQKGRLYTPQAHCIHRDGDLRIIRPFIYVRERLLEDFAVQKNLPTRPSSIFTKPLDASNSILKVQEVINPSVYDNIKCAIKPLLSIRLDTSKTSYEHIKLSLISRN